jgi:hypothetical protein
MTSHFSSLVQALQLNVYNHVSILLNDLVFQTVDGERYLVKIIQVTRRVH